jgi:hypothetical protein
MTSTLLQPTRASLHTIPIYLIRQPAHCFKHQRLQRRLAIPNWAPMSSMLVCIFTFVSIHQVRIRVPFRFILTVLGHPLHKSFIYKREVLSQILNMPLQSSTPQSQPLASIHTTSQEVFVIDCNEPNPPSQPNIGSHGSSTGYHARKRNWGSDLEMLARAWCAEKGYNALISRRGRNCIACSIREARALGWKIVLRFG